MALGKNRMGFQITSSGFGPVPFWWWVGDPLDRERLAWQLDQLKAGGIRDAVVSYNHHADGNPDKGVPPVFSDDWWELFRWLVDQCRLREMRISFQDYVLLGPLFQQIGRETPGMSAGTLTHASLRVSGPGTFEVRLPSDVRGLSGYAWRVEKGRPSDFRQIAEVLENGILRGDVPAGDWQLCAVGVQPGGFDPLHPESGARTIDRFYAPFEQHCPGELGRTISWSFQDELDFGGKMPRWNEEFLSEFRARKGYDLAPLLPALWHDIGAASPKVRIDYNDVVVQLLERNYFAPVFRWHEERGVLFGNDNCGRGAVRRGMEMYGDPFRTMRWYSAPGTDDPNLSGPRAFKGLKVNSSIAHLYGRPRVWCECFHSSGWGATPEKVIAALNADFALGMTVVNLHGLYYSTHGSWWEWAPPDFHFRQPYWKHSAALSGYVSRLSEVLSSGNHVADVAMVYPITSVEAALPSVTRQAEIAAAFSEEQAGHGASTDESEGHAFALGQRLMNEGIDFDFVDFESIERAEIRDGQIRVAGEAYRVLLFPAMAAVRFSTLEKARDFYRAGGVVIAYGRLPIASERVGLADPRLDAIVDEVFHDRGKTGRGHFIGTDPVAVIDTISDLITRDFISKHGRLQCLHRRSDGLDYYFVFNPRDEPCETDAFFRTRGRSETWNAWTGEVQEIPPLNLLPEGTELRLKLAAHEARLIVFHRVEKPSDARPNVPRVREKTIPVCGEWELELKPTMDNRFGDFRLPVRELMIGAEARRFRYAEEAGDAKDWHQKDCDDSSWPEVTFSFGPRFWLLGPLPGGVDEEGLASEFAGRRMLDPAVPVRIKGRDYFWRPYDFSLRWGVENDPFLKDWSSGPHGLKRDVPDEFIDLNCDEPGAVWLLWTFVKSQTTREPPFVMGSRSRYAAWLGGKKILVQEEEMPPGRRSAWNLPHYDSVRKRTDAAIPAGGTPLLLSFVQPVGQRVRAYAAFETGNERVVKDPVPALSWFRRPGHLVFNHRPEVSSHAGWYRFDGPPGLRALRILVRGKALRVWVDGVEMPVECGGFRDEGREHVVRLSGPARGKCRIALRIEQAADSFGGDAIPEPVLFECTSGFAPLGDWSQLGLAAYSGAAWYRKTIDISAAQAGELKAGRSFVDLGSLRASAEVFWDGRSLGVLLAPPWRVELPEPIQAGSHRLEILIANTLANHFSIGIPTRYVFEGQTVSGLIGPVNIVVAANFPTQD